MKKEVLINQQLQAVFEQAAVGMVIVEAAHSRFVKVNRRFCEIVGYSAEELLQGSIHDITHPDDHRVDLDHIERISAGVARESSWEKRYRKKDGTVVWARVFVTPLDPSEARPTLRLGVIEDITERRRIEEALRESEKRYRELSIVDDLTQLYNSRHFYHQIKMEIDRADRYGQPLTLLLLDLDDFKRFNDAYGHIEGDQVLLRLGQVVKRCLRQTDSAYRYGGEEFTILLPMTTGRDCAVTAERIRMEFKKENFSPAPGQDVHVTVSIGLSQYKPQEDMKAFVHRVDQLMYQGKKNGKDRVCSEL
ncbi:MAG: diguanylate cyclase [Deltaproteobacteria bacterium]|nr:diguanylate cyclase [Deltaproteobacteria bacterium]